MSEPYPKYRSHLWPRTRDGSIAVLAFVVLLALAEPPFVHMVVARIRISVFGVPFLYLWLLAVYVAAIAVLIRALRKGL